MTEYREKKNKERGKVREGRRVRASVVRAEREGRSEGKIERGRDFVTVGREGKHRELLYRLRGKERGKN